MEPASITILGVPRTMGSRGVPFAPERSPLALHFRLRSSELCKAGARPELRMTSGSETEVRLLPSPWLCGPPARPRPLPAGDVGPDPWGELGSAPPVLQVPLHSEALGACQGLPVGKV